MLKKTFFYISTGFFGEKKLYKLHPPTWPLEMKKSHGILSGLFWNDQLSKIIFYFNLLVHIISTLSSYFYNFKSKVWKMESIPKMAKIWCKIGKFAIKYNLILQKSAQNVWIFDLVRHKKCHFWPLYPKMLKINVFYCQKI